MIKKFLSLVLIFGVFFSGCASLGKKDDNLYIASPADAATAYVSGILSKNKEHYKKVYSLLSARTRTLVSYNEFKEFKAKDDIFTGRKIIKSTLLNAAEVAKGKVIVYILYLTEDPDRIGWRQFVVLRVYTVFEDGSFKIFLREDSANKIDFVPVFLRMKKYMIKPETMKLLYALVKEDIYDNMPKEYRDKHPKPSASFSSSSKKENKTQEVSKTVQISPVAKECIARGKELFADKNYRGALMQFEKALAIDKNAVEAKNYIRLCKEQL